MYWSQVRVLAGPPKKFVLKNLLFYLVFSFFFIFGDNSISMIIDDLSSNGKTKQGEKWSLVTDQVMGGISTGNFKLFNIEGKPCYRMTGNVSTKNNGGFIQMRTFINPNIKINDFKGIYLLVWGNNKNYNLHLRTQYTVAPWQYYSFTFLSEKKWIRINAPFSNFKKSNFYQPKKLINQEIKSIGLVAGFEDFSSDICLAEIGFY